jgi:Mg-chelatase subunit ChlD
MSFNPVVKPFFFILTAAFCLFSNDDVQAQTSSMKISSTMVDFGRIAAIVYPAKTIEFTNNGTEKLAILLIEKGPNVKVNFERRFYQPGEKGIISIYYEARDPGDFNEEIKIFSNLDNEPISVLLKGTCISIQECFPDIHNLLKRNILVVDKISKAPVPSSVVTFVHNHDVKKPFVVKVDKKGKAVEELPIGLYNAEAAVTGYEPYANEFFLPKTYPNVLIELTPKQTAPPVAIETPAFVSSEKTGPKVTSSELPENKYAANNIVLLLDVSGSMNSQGKFTLLKQSINNLVIILRPIDYVSIITYATESRVVLPGLPGNEKEKISGIVQELVPHGNTQGVKGLNTAYDLALKQFIKGGNNQVILATDGEFSEKGVTDEYYQQFISGFAKKGIKLSILGFGANKSAIERMNKMASSGEGRCVLINSEKYIKNILIEEIKKMSFMEGR